MKWTAVVIARTVTISIASIRHVYTYKCDLTTLIVCKFMKLLFCYSWPHCQWYGETGIFFQYFLISYVLLQMVAHIWALLTFHTCVTVFWGCTSWNTCILSRGLKYAGCMRPTSLCGPHCSNYSLWPRTLLKICIISTVKRGFLSQAMKTQTV